MTFIVLSFVVAACSLLVIIMPFFVGKGGRLAPASSMNDLGKLEDIRKQIIDRYVEEKGAFESKQITSGTWKKRQEFLENRYIDVCRRLDFLGRQKETEAQ